MSVTIRPLQFPDEPDALRMRRALWPDCPDEEHLAELRAYLTGRSDAAMFVAVAEDGTLCGFAEVDFRSQADGCDSQPVAFLEGWYVDEPRRRTGVGAALVRAVEAWAAQHGGSELGSDADLRNPASHAAHLALGFREVGRVVQYHKPLPDPPTPPRPPLGGNLFADIPSPLREEHFTPLVSGPQVRVERIVSRGQTSPPGFWYDQDEDEMVLVVAGAARLFVAGRGEVELGPGDWIELPRHVRHRVTWTDPDQDTVWLAIFRRGPR